MSSERGGGGGSSTSSNSTNVSVTTNVVGPPININVGGDFLKPVAETFAPVADSVQRGIQTISNQAASIAEFTQKSNQQLTTRQDDLERLIKLALAVTLAGVGFQFIRAQGRAA